MSEPSTPESVLDPINADIHQHLTSLSEQMAALAHRVDKLEEKLLLIPDLDRYGKLQDFLSRGLFKDADLETTQIILDTVAMKRDELNPEQLVTFPCTTLTVIDRLWGMYSQDRFGFGLQLEIYQQCGGDIDTLRTQDRKIMGRFAQEVGWVVEGELQFPHYDEWDFSVNAPKGCFPAIWWRSPYGLKMVTFFFMRLLECGI